MTRLGRQSRGAFDSQAVMALRLLFIAIAFHHVNAQSDGVLSTFGDSSCSGPSIPSANLLLTATGCTDIGGGSYARPVCSSDSDASGYHVQYSDSACTTVQVTWGDATSCGNAASLLATGSCPVTAGSCFSFTSSPTIFQTFTCGGFSPSPPSFPASGGVGAVFSVWVSSGAFTSATACPSGSAAFSTTVMQPSGCYDVYGSGVRLLSSYNPKLIVRLLALPPTRTVHPGRLHLPLLTQTAWHRAFCLSDTDTTGYLIQYSDSSCTTEQYRFNGGACGLGAGALAIGTW